MKHFNQKLKLFKKGSTYVFALATLIVLTSIKASAQSGTTISGSVVDSETGEDVIGATVYLEGTSSGSVADYEGKYSLTSNLSGEQVLVVSFVGYSTIRETITLGEGDVFKDFSLGLDMIGLDMVIVTGVVNPKSKLESSVSVTSLDSKTISQSAPRTTAEIFRTIPGIKAEASAGDGNTNITVRGVPISAGGSRYLQIQEDGLPVILYGDIAFGTQDQWVRFDQNIDRVEAIRGGSAATFTSNGPAGIINFISKTGNTAGGSVGTSFGLDYNSFRSDFEYGAPINENTFFHVGGFFREGEGPRRANHTVNKGGQIKMNLTKTFDKGLIRVNYKMLNDRTAAYMPMPIEVSGTNASPKWESVEGFDAVSNGLQSPLFQQNFGYGPDGNLRRSSMSDGIHANNQSVGAFVDFDLDNGWALTSNNRMSFNNGRFVAPFTAEVGTSAAIADGIAVAAGYEDGNGVADPYTLNYVSGGGSFNNPNGLLQRIHVFDVELENFNNFMSDTQLKKSFGNVGLTAGLFRGSQNIGKSWLWTTFISEVGQDADLVNIEDTTTGDDLTDNGLANYGVPLWGNCCTGRYNTNYQVTAPYMSMSIEASENLNIDASLRYDDVKVRGTVTGNVVGPSDVNQNGSIEVPEQTVAVIDNASAKIVSYDYNYMSWSAGANLKLSTDNAVFARLSQGYVGNAERATWHQGGPYLENGAPKNSLFQGELGYKKKFATGGLFVTAFYAKTKEEAGVEATTQNVLSNDYKSLGLEVEASFRFGNLDLRSAVTYVKAEISDNDGDSNIGNNPRRQPAFQYNLMPTYNVDGGHSFGLSIMGQSKAYAQDNNDLVMPGYMIVNAFVATQLSEGLTFSLSANNLLNAIGITESEEGSITDNQTNYLRARSITGRSIVASVNLRF